MFLGVKCTSWNEGMIDITISNLILIYSSDGQLVCCRIFFWKYHEKYPMCGFVSGLLLSYVVAPELRRQVSVTETGDRLTSDKSNLWQGNILDLSTGDDQWLAGCFPQPASDSPSRCNMAWKRLANTVNFAVRIEFSGRIENWMFWAA